MNLVIIIKESIIILNMQSPFILISIILVLLISVFLFYVACTAYEPWKITPKIIISNILISIIINNYFL